MLAVVHVPWEGPHRIEAALEAAGIPVMTRHPLAGEPLPDPARLSGALIMGGPMNVDDTARHPGLAAEHEWVGRALAAGLPLLGICLGSQLIARGLGAAVVPGPAPEIGWAPVEVAAADDPVVGTLAPATTVLHWHGDRFDVPPGARALASSALTPCQAFRAGDAWGLLFHPEADAALVEHWLEEPAMAAELEAANGPDAAAALRADTIRHAPAAAERGDAAIGAWCAVAGARRAALLA